MSKMNDAIKLAVSKGYIVIGNDVFSSLNKKLKLGKDGSGYNTFGIRIGNTVYGRIGVHKLVAYQKYGDKAFEDGIEVRHLNGDKNNNTVENILIGTRKENANDIPKEKRIEYAKNASKHLRVLTDEQEKNLILDRANGMEYNELAKKYNIAKSTAHYIVHKVR